MFKNFLEKKLWEVIKLAIYLKIYTLFSFSQLLQNLLDSNKYVGQNKAPPFNEMRKFFCFWNI